MRKPLAYFPPLIWHLSIQWISKSLSSLPKILIISWERLRELQLVLVFGPSTCSRDNDAHSGWGQGVDRSQTFVTLRGEVPGMPVSWHPSERERHCQQALTGKVKPWLCWGASHDSGTELEDNEAECSGESFLSKGTCHSINGWGDLAKSQCRSGQELELRDWHIPLPYFSMYRGHKETMPVVWAVQTKMVSRTNRRSQITVQVASVFFRYVTRHECYWPGCSQTQKKAGQFFMRKLKCWCRTNPHSLLLFNEEEVMGNFWQNWYICITITQHKRLMTWLSPERICTCI